MTIPQSVLDRFPDLDDAFVEARLGRPGPSPRVIIDTDTANEIDDQYALAWALLSPERLELEGVTAVPFSFAHHRDELIESVAALRTAADSGEAKRFMGGLAGWAQRLIDQGRRAEDVSFVGPEQGAELSYQEILRVYDKCGVAADGQVHRGSPGYLHSLDAPLDSPAARFIVERARAADDRPLYVLAMGALTNIASALLMAPDIVRNIVVVWTSGFPSYAPFSNAPSLNLVQDRLASQLLFDCGVPLVYLPGYHVGAQLKLSLPEMERFVRGRGAIGAYLHHLYTHNPLHEMFAITGAETKTWVIWDVINVAWLFDESQVSTFMTRAPLLDDGLCWQHPAGRHPMLEAFDLNRDAIFEDLYRALERAPG
ncbi:nucleoside hydrolase [Halovulum marinum]|uniref:nucleoside hydrolase n=1 Tax=Halovulum marinum TaxID=2662447 RepID=UPI001F38C1FA|nr:nucleoside hydrolase [Halovulum marinum]